MGTRHLIAAFIDGDYKLAQYGQWDGYPEGQGAGVLDFLNGADLEVFKTKLRACTWMTKEEGQALDAAGDWRRTHPHLSRDAGSDVLDLIMKADKPLFLKDTRGFAGDSLMCEFAYVIDFDKGTFEVFKGFNKTPTPPDSRFPSGADWLERTEPYEPVALVKSYQLDALPTKDGFLFDFSDPEEDDGSEDEAA